MRIAGYLNIDDEAGVDEAIVCIFAEIANDDMSTDVAEWLRPFNGKWITLTVSHHMSAEASDV